MKAKIINKPLMGTPWAYSWPGFNEAQASGQGRCRASVAGRVQDTHLSRASGLPTCSLIIVKQMFEGRG
jgi:hypothetical protein